jgi:hypothetical protein
MTDMRKDSMKFGQHLLSLLLAVCSIQQLPAAIPIDLGPSLIVTNEIDRIAFSDLNGTPVTGTLSVDFDFSGNAFVRLFSQYFVANPYGPPVAVGTGSSFDVSLVLQTSGVGLVGFLQGTGYLTDEHGIPIPGYGVTGSSSSDEGMMAIGLFPLFRDDSGSPNTELIRPFDFYGVHFDLIFPDVPSLEVTGGEFGLYDNGVFGIGPNIPSDIPEPRSSILLLGALILAISVNRIQTGRTHQQEREIPTP